MCRRCHEIDAGPTLCLYASDLFCCQFLSHRRLCLTVATRPETLENCVRHNHPWHVAHPQGVIQARQDEDTNQYG